MRYLNKVIFIESANIRYAEVKLDGNVHLIGTQGVGKSTLLRALLFFYNANQQKLGIPIEKKRFVEFYFPYQNSFIIYEVMHENGAFCVLAYKSQGRIVFRFFNSAYKPEFFIETTDRHIAEATDRRNVGVVDLHSVEMANGHIVEAENRHVTKITERHIADSWDQVRDNLGRNHVKFTRLIDRYEEYRNIIYGNNKGLGAEFRKYALLESKQYQNIPRAIQHVFLNYKVESDFIKDTIIKSLNDDEMPIDLSNYTLHLKDFETQLNDINLWTEKSTKGENRIRRLADKIVETYSQIRFTEQDFEYLSAALMHKLNENEQQQTKWDIRLTKEQEKEDTVIERQAKTQKNYDDRKSKLSEEKGVYVNKLKEAKQKSEEYRLKNIEEVLQRIAQKSDLLKEQQDLSSQKRLLESHFNDIRQKYELQIEQLHNQFESSRNTQQEKGQLLDVDFFRFKEFLSVEYDEAVEAIKKQFEDKRRHIKNQIEDKKEELTKLRNKLFEAKHTPYCAGEISKCTEQIRIDNEQIQQANHAIVRLENDNSTLKTQWELEKQRLEEVAENEKNTLRNTHQQLSEKRDAIRLRIENSKDSLYGWLSKEYPGWEKTIGKVIDEDRILFKAGLSPQIVTATPDSFYGLKINLDEIEKEVKTVADYEVEITNIEKDIEAVKSRYNDADRQLNDRLDVLKKKYLPRIKKNKEAIERYRYDAAQYKISSDKANVELGAWQRKAETDKQSRIEEVNRLTDKVTVEKTDAESEWAAVEVQIEKKIKTKQKEKESKTAARQTQLDTEKEIITQALIAKKQETDMAIQTLKTSLQHELHNKGADTQQINSLEEKLQAIATELSYIEENTELAFNYRKDEKELFNKVDSFKTQRDLLESKLQEAEAKHTIQQQKLSMEREEIRTHIVQLQKDLSAIEDDTKRFAEFQQSEVYLDHITLFQERMLSSSVGNAVEKIARKNVGNTVENAVGNAAGNTVENAVENGHRHFSGVTLQGVTASPLLGKSGIVASSSIGKSGVAIMEELTARYYARMKYIDQLKENINKFNGNFSENNIFKFKTKLIENAEYRQFAEDLKEFIEEDKINEYEKRVNELFARIIQQVGNETEQLLSKENAIRKVINDINNDFVRRNFAGVIKSIELRMVSSSNKIVQLLGEIKSFNDENIDSFGEVNLFTANQQNREENNRKAVQYLASLSKAIAEYRNNMISLSDSFELEFRVVENDNDTGWVDKLANVGSDGTDVLVKAMINIMLLNVFKEGATKNQFKDFRLHCMMDEIGKLHPNNVRGILKFANDRNIFLVNGSPQSFDALAYKYTYKLSKRTDVQTGKAMTIINRLVTNNRM